MVQYLKMFLTLTGGHNMFKLLSEESHTVKQVIIVLCYCIN